MIKWAPLAAASLLMINNVHAEPRWHGYKDSFRITSTTHPDIAIQRGYSDQDVLLQITSPRTFVLRDGPQHDKGFVHLEVTDSLGNWCLIDIQDGPWKNHPMVDTSCKGLNYLGTKYDGSHSYSIHFD